MSVGQSDRGGDGPQNRQEMRARREERGERREERGDRREEPGRPDMADASICIDFI